MTARLDVWETIAEKWNDDTYNPVSTKYKNLHKDFDEEIDLSHREMEGMGLLTGERAKSKFNKLKNGLLFVKANFEKSGNGDGALCKVSKGSEVDDEDEDEYEMIENGNDVGNFLNGMTSAVLCLWMKADEYQLLNTVCQKLPEEVGFDTASRREKTGGKKKGNDSEEKKVKAFVDINSSIQEIKNIALLEMIYKKEKRLFAEEDELFREVEGSERYKLKKRRIERLEKELTKMQDML